MENAKNTKCYKILRHLQNFHIGNEEGDEPIFKHDNTPKVSLRGVANAEFDLTKDGYLKATVDVDGGRKGMLGFKLCF